MANCVGGNGDCQDDVIDFDLLTDIAWSLDDDNIGGPAFGTDPVGVGAPLLLRHRVMTRIVLIMIAMEKREVLLFKSL